MHMKDLLARRFPNTVKARLGSAFWSLKTVYWSLREFLDPGAQRQGLIPPKSLIASVGGLDFQATGQEFKRYFIELVASSLISACWTWAAAWGAWRFR